MAEPTKQQLKALDAASKHSRGSPTVINSGDAEECEDLGWLEHQPGGGYGLTSEGRRVLTAASGEEKHG
jgi:hypothetical protein